MRLHELFETIVMEAPDKNGATVSMSLADLYDMTGKPYPTKPGPNGNPITPPGFFKKKDMSVGEGGIDQELANAHKQWVDGGKLPGILLDEDGELKPYNENGTLEDLSWAFIAGGAELLNSWIKGAAVPIDDFINEFTMVGRYTKASTGENLSNLKTSTLSGYDKIDEKFWGDEVVDWFNSKTDQSFRDKVAWTSGAVNNFNDVRDLFYGHTGFNIEGAAGIMIGELPSEIVDLAVIMSTGPLAGMAISGSLNALEAGGAAAQSITDRINAAYKKGVLQNSPQYKMYLDAAMMQLQADDIVRKPAELIEEAQDLARKHAIDMSIRNAFYKVAVTGGVIDAVQNKILYGKGKISSGFLKNAVLKGVAGTTGEGVSGYLEQVFENQGIIKGAGGNITTATEGAFNAAYNEMLASQSGNVLATTVDGASRARAGVARLSQFIMGGRRDPKAILDIMAMDSNTLINRIETVDPETGVRKFAIAELIKKRLVTSDQLTKSEQRSLSRTGSFYRDGKRYTRKEVQENTDNVALVALLDDVEINPEENTSTVNLDDEAQARKLAQLLGIDKDLDGKAITKDTDINKVLAQLENVRKIDVRIEGRSTLEPPVWTDLDDMQKMEYWKDGKVTFTNDPERGNQTWTRQQVMFNSRRNNVVVPDEVANLLDNAPTRDSIGKEFAQDAEVADQLMKQLEQGARRKLQGAQTAWDNRNQKSIDDGDGPLDPSTRPTEENNEDFKTFFNSSLYTVQKDKYDFAIKNMKEEQKAWDSEYGLTHNFDGSPKKGSQMFADKQRFDAKAEQMRKEQERKEKALETVKQNEGVTDFDASEAPHVPVTKGGDPVSDEKVAISRKHYIAHAKIKIANGEMESDELDAFLKASEKVYPGSSKEIISDEARANYEKIDLRPSAKESVIQDFEKPTENIANTRPPEGAEVTFQGKKYVWLGVAKGKGGMWAEVKEDGSRGTTAHPFHKDLNTEYQKQNINTERSENTKTNTENNPPDKEIVDKVKKNVQTEISGENESTPFLVEPPKEGDEQYIDTKIPKNVEDDFREVLATKNAIKIQNFLKSLPTEQAGALRMNPQKYQPAPKAPIIGEPPEQPTTTGSTATDGPATPAIDNLPKIGATPTLGDPAKRGELPKSAQPPGTPPSVGDTPAQPTTTGSTATDGPDTPATDDLPKIGDRPTLGDPAKRGDLPDLDISTPPPPKGGRGTPETPAQSRERVAAYKKRQAELDQAKRDAEQKAKDEITPDLSPDGKNMPKVKSKDLTGIEDPDANQPVQFTPTDKLTKQQKAELDKIAQDNQAAADKAMGDRTPKVKDTGTKDAGVDDKNKATDNTAAYNQAQADKAQAQDDANYSDQTNQDDTTATIDPTDVATGATIGTQLAKPKNSKLTTKLKNKNQKVDKTGVLRKGARLGWLGGNDDGGDENSLMKFYPANYQDPLDLEKYKGAIGRSQSALPTGQSK